MIMELTSITGLKGEVSIPGDKSISHRSVMFASLANGMTEIHNFLSGADCLATIDCFRKMGIKIEEHQNRILVHGKGLHGLTAPSETLQVKTAERLPACSPVFLQDSHFPLPFPETSHSTHVP